MFFKKDLIEAINDLSHDLTALAIRTTKLECRVKDLEKEVFKVKKPVKTAAQPRDKSGKFAKKK